MVSNPNLNGLYEIVGDLWETLQEDARKIQESPEPPKVPESAGQKPDKACFDALWQTEDETIDWTEYLTLPLPAWDGFDPETRQFLHSQAHRVLRGDLQGYASVLQKLRPLDDLRAYAHKISVEAPDPDRLKVSFTCGDEDAHLAGTDRDALLCGIALRCARDLFSILPVTEVHVVSGSPDNPDLTAVFHRNLTRQTLFRLTDPVSFVTQKAEGVLRQMP